MGVAVIILSWLLFDHFHHVSGERSVYIVYMDKSSMPKAFSSHHYWYSSMLKSVKSVPQASFNSLKPEPKLIYTYDNAFHGFSALVSEAELEALKNHQDSFRPMPIIFSHQTPPIPINSCRSTLPQGCGQHQSMAKM
ncbi:UNVERIFIED_CONTAM: Subtilisin-like protease SBT3 [Sesamum latifolium]|uniref:Subtilisin-like protease SBT3 n=1 Tax=Sesamum latifolium TaxID=2727402 RepID=A0AAW2VXI9_9LAMI